MFLQIINHDFLYETVTVLKAVTVIFVPVSMGLTW